MSWLRRLFHSEPQCPIDAPTRKWVDHRWSWLESQFGAELAQKVDVVLPRPEFFPDPFAGTDEDARRLFDRVCGYMQIDPATVELSLYDEERPIADNPIFAAQQWHGTAGLYHAEGGKFRIWVEAENLNDPLGMVATMSHELGHVHLLGHRRLTGEEEDHEPLTDLLTVFFGMGILTANSVIREQSWQDGPYAGWKIGRRGYLGMPIYGYALALFARSRGEDGLEWSGELRPDVRSAFTQSMRFLADEVERSPDAAGDDNNASREAN
jgi:hypothetical protein